MSRNRLTLKVAPSNVERIARLLQKRLGIEQEKARQLAASSPVEVEVGTDKSRARQLARDIIESGGQADITLRRVAIRMRNVMLAAVGAKKFAVIAALREHVDLGIVEAKTLVEEAPSVVATEMVQPRAEALVAALKAAGCTGPPHLRSCPWTAAIGRAPRRSPAAKRMDTELWSTQGQALKKAARELAGLGILSALPPVLSTGSSIF